MTNTNMKELSGRTEKLGGTITNSGHAFEKHGESKNGTPSSEGELAGRTNKLGGKLTNVGGIHQSAGESKHSEPSDGITKSHKNLNSKLGQDGQMVNTGSHIEKLSEWSIDGLAASMNDSDIDIQTLFDSYAESNKSVSLEEFKKLASCTYGYNCLIDNDTFRDLLVNSDRFTFAESYGDKWDVSAIGDTPYGGAGQEKPGMDEIGMAGCDMGSEDACADSFANDLSQIGDDCIPCACGPECRCGTPDTPMMGRQDGLPNRTVTRSDLIQDADDDIMDDIGPEGDVDIGGLGQDHDQHHDDELPMDDFQMEQCSKCGFVLDDAGCASCDLKETHEYGMTGGQSANVSVAKSMPADKTTGLKDVTTGGPNKADNLESKSAKPDDGITKDLGMCKDLGENEKITNKSDKTTLENNACKIIRSIRSQLAENIKHVPQNKKYSVSFDIKTQNGSKTVSQLSEAALDIEESLQCGQPTVVTVKLMAEGKIYRKFDAALPRVTSRDPIRSESKILFRYIEHADKYSNRLVSEGKTCKLVKHNWGCAVKIIN